MGLARSLALAAASFAVILSVQSLTGGLAAAPSIQSHRAIYGLNLGGTRSDSTVIQASGVLEFEWSDACDAWTVSQRARVELSHRDGEQLSFGWIFNSWEAKDGTGYRFYIRRLYGAGRDEQVKGEARMAGIGEGGTAYFSLPTEREVELPSGVIFPTRHTLSLLGHLEADDLPFWTTVFDGSTDDGLYGVSAMTSGMLPENEAVPLDSAILTGKPSWRLAMAFFGMNQAEAEPEQEQKLRLFSNGVTDDLTFDYGDFALDAKLQELESLPDSGC